MANHDDRLMGEVFRIILLKASKEWMRWTPVQL